MVLGIILYQLADRYLIQHVEMTNALSNTTSTVQSTESNNATTTKEDYNADEWSYTSDTETIQIKKVEAGSSNNPIVYYVAEVELKDASSLKSAFANNQFGNNITENTSVIASEIMQFLRLMVIIMDFERMGLPYATDRSLETIQRELGWPYMKTVQ